MVVHRAVRADRVIILALTVGFTSLAALVMHVRRIAAISLLAYYVGVGTAVAFSIPIVIWAMRAADSGQRLRRALLSTTAAGVLVSEAITVTIIAVLPGERERRDVIEYAGWMLQAVPLGAVSALAACVALLLGARLIETRYAAPSADVVSRIAVPMLSVAGLAAGAVTVLLDPRETLVVLYGAWAALVGLAVVAREDLDRLRWLGRIFAGTDPDHVLEACSLGDESRVQRFVDLAYAGSLVRRRVEPASYRAPACGEALAVLGFTEMETKRPIRRRIAVATIASGGIAFLAVLALVLQS